MRPFWGLEYLNPVPFYSWEDELSKFSAGPVQDPRDWAETYSAQLRSYPCHPSSTMTELFLNLVQKLSGILFFLCIWSMIQSDNMSYFVGKSKTWILTWLLCIWIWFCWIVLRQKCLLIFGQTLLILASVCSSCQLMRYKVDSTKICPKIL